MNISFGEVMEGRQLIADYVIYQKSKKPFTVIDVGGSATGWSLPIAAAFVDINKVDTFKTQFVVDICKQDSWNDLLLYVAMNGKFDFSICTHTLEDIYNPYLVLDHLPLIAKSGIISMPSIKTELNFVESLNWSGFLHHRYLFGHKQNKIVIVPKLPVIEKLTKQTLNVVEEIRYQWDNSIQYEVFMDNYLGPNTDTVLKRLEQFIKEQM